ncbi:hypothetical protein DIS18_01680 [Algibacter marinivivus]|uniref:Secretion system C-terminal sorting domain-containing protein n=1 Tax=Algibacter marinivivus TaxID=2100723 RepID=A0A2U2X678_9FLAO|nr:T9SS type A sorting domain-containing protein [Algibacter marinivivus]PWH83289.1 hypothetical protein DIS18_01680 [Algibacter marinivivus]
MKKITILLLLLVVPFIGVAQVFTNGTFDANVDGWIPNSGSAVTHDAVEGDTAAGSIKLVTVAANGRAQSNPNASPGVAGDYLLTFKVKGTAGTKIQGSIFQGSLTGGDNYTIVGSDWEEYTHLFTGILDSNMNIRIVGKDASSTYFIDDVSFVKATVVTENSFVSNPDFEAGFDTDWSVLGADIDISSATGDGSATAVQVDFTQNATTNNNNLINIVHDFGTTVNPSEVTSSFRVNTNNTGIGIQMSAQTLDASDVVVETLNSANETVAAADTWETLSFSKATTAPFNKILFRIKVRGNGTALAGDKVLIDDIVASFTYISLGINDFSRNDDAFKLYPNPVKDLLNIKSLDASMSSISIYDITGKRVLQSNTINDGKINVSNLNSGIYVIRLEDANRNFSVKKLVVSK